MGKPRVVYWFRTDLRLHDSPALQAALDLSPEVLWPVFTWDPHYVYKAKGGVNRWQYLLDCQNDLSKSITKLNPKSKLFVLREGPQTLFPKLFKAWGVTHLVFERDTDIYAKERDRVVTELAQEAGIKVITRYGRTLWDSDEVVAKNGGKPTMSIVQLQHAGQKIGQIPKPIPAPKSLPDPGETPVDFKPDEPDRNPDLNTDFREKTDKSYSTIAGPKGDFAPETMEELGFPPATTPHRGGETIALKTLGEIISDKKYTATFQKPKTSPAAFEPQATTLLSPHMHFGSLSVRLFYWKAQEVVDGYGKGASSPPESLTGQLLFRDMYFAAQAGIGAPFGQTLNNPYVRFIPWHLPSNVTDDADAGDGPIAISGSYRVDSPVAEKWFQRWKYGVTGFPFVDALMRQLRQEGWIHHLGRHLVACFLTRGGCYVHWERGCEVFEEWLLDHEPACNAGNWQWLSCTAFFSQFFRCYSPVAFGKKWDKSGALIRRYVPELKNLDEKYIYEPWKAPPQALASAKVKIEGDGMGDPKEGVYPAPMLDFNERRTICLNAMKTAYHIGLHGDDEKVKDGSWKKLFEDAGEKEMDGGEIHSDDNGSEADDAEHENHKRKRSTGRRRKSDAAKEGPMDRHLKKTKAVT